jgi:diguanylate cyclase (GGDEF)-like protein
LCLLRCERSGLWVGTSGGLAHFDAQTDRFRAFTVADGLPSPTVFSCLEDDHGILWLGTTDGLVRFDPSSHHMTVYGVGDGLPSREFNQGAGTSARDGRLLFGTMNGVAMFHPDAVGRPDDDIPILITTVSSDAARIWAPAGWPSGETVHLDAESRDVTFGFVGIDYRNPSQVRYSTLLEGYDRRWRDTGTVPAASYTRLPSGHFTLRVRCRGSRHEGNHEARLGFDISPTLLERWWFRVLVSAVGVGGMLGLSYLRIRTIRKQRDQLRREVDMRTRELAVLASTDSLTGVANRRHFMEAAAQEVARFRKEGVPLCMLMVDIDHFKHINDTYGHPVGDATLKAMVASLRQLIRCNDLIGRLGGDEFAVLLPGADLPRAAQVAERIRSELTRIAIEGSPRPAAFTVSVGVASLRETADDLEQLLTRADEAMYQAKNAGRNRVVVEMPTEPH